MRRHHSGAARFREYGPEFPHRALVRESRANFAHEENLVLPRLATQGGKASRYRAAEPEKPGSANLATQKNLRLFASVRVFQNQQARRQAERSFCSPPLRALADRALSRPF